MDLAEQCSCWKTVRLSSNLVTFRVILYNLYTFQTHQTFQPFMSAFVMFVLSLWFFSCSLSPRWNFLVQKETKERTDACQTHLEAIVPLFALIYLFFNILFSGICPNPEYFWHPSLLWHITTSKWEVTVFIYAIHSFPLSTPSLRHPVKAEHDSCQQLSSEVILFELMSEERGSRSAFAFKHLWWMTPVPVACAVISLTPDRSEVLKENGKLIYLNFHPEQTVHPRNPTRRCAERLENCRRVLPVVLMWKSTILISSYAIVSLCCTTINVI